MPRELPPGVRNFAYLPYSLLFPRAAAVIHQAGIGTLAQALRAGRPQLIVPVAFDQADNADRTARLGVARVIPFRKVTTGALVSELERLLSSPSYGERARAVADDLTHVNGATRTAGALIACLHRIRARPEAECLPDIDRPRAGITMSTAFIPRRNCMS